MDSFYDLPRTAPNNFNSTKPMQQVAVFDVPEVSMISNRSTNPLTGDSPNYPRINDAHLSYNAWKYRTQKTNGTTYSESPSFLLKKQVRFENQRRHRDEAALVQTPSFSYENDEPKAPIASLRRGTRLEDIYMANIQTSRKENVISPTNVRNGCISMKNDLINRRFDIPAPRYDQYRADRTIDDRPAEPKKPQEPTVADLMKIIQRQSEQLTELQSQINYLIEDKRKEPAKMALNENVLGNIMKPSANGQVPKFSMNLTTSFEVSFRAQKNFPPRLGKENLFSPRISEIPEESKLVTEDSLSLGPTLAVEDRPESPERSIHVDMQDYSSDDESGSEIGCTFYDKVLGQVNNILQRNDVNKQPAKAMRKVQEATLKHLKSIGVDVPVREIDELSESGSSKEISFAVKQILMKYLPDELLTKVVTAEKGKRLEPRRPEFSFATVQYMKKYNLLSDGYKEERDSSPNRNSRNKQSPKILDITALKQQPKLL